MRATDETKQRVEHALLQAIEHAAGRVVANAEVDLWARAAADLAVAYRALTHYDDAPLGLGLPSPAPARTGARP